MSKGFKKFPHDWRKRVFKELKGIRLSVWMYHWSRSGPDDTVQTTLDQLVADLPYSRNRIIEGRAWLRDRGWLEVLAPTYRNEQGKWSVPTFKPVIPQPKEGLVDEQPKGVSGPTAEKVVSTDNRKAGTAKRGTTVDTQISVDTSESDATRLPVNTSSSLSTLSPLNVTSTSNEIAEILGIMKSGEIELQDPDKALAFARWMIGTHPLKKDGSPRIISLRDFLHHWNNESGSDYGFRLQWEAIQGIQKKTKEVPRSEWDWMCRAPACNKPWTEELDGIKLCGRCFAAFPDHPAEKEVKWVHPCECSYEDEILGIRRCCQPATEQVGDYWICPAHIDAVREQLYPVEAESR